MNQTIMPSHQNKAVNVLACVIVRSLVSKRDQLMLRSCSALLRIAPLNQRQ